MNKFLTHTSLAPGFQNLRIFQVLPRGMRFEEESATSIDLCVAEFVTRSAFAERTTIFAEFSRTALLSNARSFKTRSTSGRVEEIAQAARSEYPDIIIVHQHLPTAARIVATLPNTAVVLQVHNFQKRSKSSLAFVRAISDRLKMQRYMHLAGMIFVSEAVTTQFKQDFDVDLPGIVLPNGFNSDAFVPHTGRELEILCTGRLAPEKGIYEAAIAVVDVLRARPDWRATFILSETNLNHSYADRCLEILSQLPDKIRILKNIPHQMVKEANGRAAIALVPSKWREPFGRTALEAHAGGAALISSGTGGLREISETAALYLDEVSAHSISAALLTLIDTPHLRQELATAGLRRACEHFELRALSANLDSFVSEIVHRRAQDRKVMFQAEHRHHSISSGALSEKSKGVVLGSKP